MRISSRKDWIEKWFGGLGARRSNELRCPTRWEVFWEVVECDFLRPLMRIFTRAKDSHP